MNVFPTLLLLLFVVLLDFRHVSIRLERGSYPALFQYLRVYCY